MKKKPRLKTLNDIEKGAKIEMHLKGEVISGVVEDFYEVPRFYGHDMILRMNGVDYKVIERPKSDRGYFNIQHHAKYREI